MGHYKKAERTTNLMASVELSVLKAFCMSKELFDKYQLYVSSVKNLDRDVRVLFSTISQYYEKYQTEKSVEKENLHSYYDLSNPAAKDSRLHHEMINAMSEITIDPKILEDHLQNFLERHYASDIVAQLRPVVEGHKFGLLDKQVDRLAEYVSKMKYPPASVTALQPKDMSVKELIEKEVTPAGLTWPLMQLNKDIGVVRRGKFGIEYAYVDTGKSSFGWKCVAYWLEQLKDQDKKKIIYAGNEEGFGAGILRGTQTITGMSKAEIRDDPNTAALLRAENGWHNLLVFDSIYHINDVRKLLDRYRPYVMVIDQVTKLRSDSKTQDVEALTSVSNFCREAAKEFDAHILGLAQATGDSFKKMWLELPDLYGSRVGIQGELDYAIGIGIGRDEDRSNYRYFSITKNKFGDHSRFTALFNPAINDWTEI